MREKSEKGVLSNMGRKRALEERELTKENSREHRLKVGNMKRGLRTKKIL